MDQSLRVPKHKIRWVGICNIQKTSIEEIEWDRNNMEDFGNRLKGKKTIVTGGSRGIGAGIAKMFIEHGADVLVNYNSSASEADKLVKSLNSLGKGRAISFKADVSKLDEIKSLIVKAENEFGRIDVLVNNAGILIPKDFLSSTEDEFDRIITVNLKAVFFCCQQVAPLMIKQGKGKIINISSISGMAQASALAYPNYVASKAGVIGLTRSLAVNLAPNILVNTVAPGAIETDMISGLPEAKKKNMADEAFVKRTGRPNEIASACVFLASDESDFITGEILTVGGGRGMR
jgi:3-oxoacyl-[acyl-carrier protein] reductase